jgi:ferrochelatase
MYGRIGGKSPILDITRAQANALEKVLNAPYLTPHVSPPFRVSVGMRYWHPFIEDTLRQMYHDGMEAVLGISLYPHYSLATTGSAVSRFTDALKQYSMDSFCVSSWYDHPLYIEALVESIQKALHSFHGAHAEVLFSAHSLPMSIVESGDPYVSHIQETIKAVEKRMDIPWHLSYQSKSGPVRWLGPSTEDTIRRLADKGVQNLLVVPISFVSDHIETLYEIDILYKQYAEQLGMKLIRAESLNTSPLFIRTLEDIVMKKSKELGWIE